MLAFGFASTHPVTIRQILDFTRWEVSLAKDRSRRPHRLTSVQFDQVRYLLNFSRLTRFRPGSARIPLVSGAIRPEADVSQQITNLRNRVHQIFSVAFPMGRIRYGVLIKGVHELWKDMAQLRGQVLRHHSDEFSEEELDAEICQKTWVSVAGGGGGAGYVYLGAYMEMHEAGLIPGYIVGSSIGSIMGLLRARNRIPDFQQILDLSYSLRRDSLLRVISMKRRYGMPGLFRLYLRGGISPHFSGSGGTPMRLTDLEIPYEAVVAGIPRGALRESMDDLDRDFYPYAGQVPAWKIRAKIAEQFVKLMGYLNPLLCKEILIGSTPLTRDFDAVDAVGFSSAVPGIIHYDVTREDPRMHDILSSLFRQEDLAALVDGGVANNVACRTAFQRVMEGNIGTRNALIIGFDCFAPKILQDQHLYPIQAVVQLQVALNRPYAATIINFPRTLSPFNVMPSRVEIDWSVDEGRRVIGRELEWIRLIMSPAKFVREIF
ncbi:MAG: patatin-like phospholipase family protein [Deltaproteobacteria bacterium]|nr:patatin-like phospholipase family protein [Deltaproteobacteria bacterium]